MRNRYSRSGSALIVTMFVIIIMVAFAGSYVAVTTMHSQASDGNVDTTMSFYAAESGLDACLASLNNSGTGYVVGQLTAVAGQGMAFRAIEANNDGIDNNNNGIIDDATETGTYTGAWYQARPTVAFQFFDYGDDDLDNDNDGEVDESDEKDYYIGEVFSAGSSGGYVTTICSRITGTRNSAFAFGMFGDEYVTITGAKAMTDSYNSGKGSYVDQLTVWGDNDKDDDGDGKIDEQDETTHANGMGDVGTNGVVTLNGTPIIFGDVAYLEGINLGAGAIYGDIGQIPTPVLLDPIPPADIEAARLNNNNAGILITQDEIVMVPREVETQQEVWVWEDYVKPNGMIGQRKVLKTITVTETIFEPQVVVSYAPINPVPTSLSVKPNESISLPAGTYYFESMDIKGDVIIDGDVTIYCTGDVNFQTSSKVFNTNRKPTALTLLCTGPTMSLNANVDFYGAIYAPDTDIAINSNFTDIYGSVIGNSIKMAGNAAFHYDEALGEKGWSPRFLWAIKSWEMRHNFSAQSRTGGNSFEDYYELTP